jgi:hypothetical protein
MTGLLLVVEAAKVIDAPISIEDAMKLIFSGGLVVPSSAPRAATPEEAKAAAEEQLRDIEAADIVLAKDLPPNLPRAEDFDFGDPDIMASTVSGHASASRPRGWRALLPWGN